MYAIPVDCFLNFTLRLFRLKVKCLRLTFWTENENLGFKDLIGNGVDNLGDSGFLQCLGASGAGLGQTGLTGPVYPCYINGGSPGVAHPGKGINFCMDGNILAASFIVKNPCGRNMVSPLVSSDGQNTAGTDNDCSMPLVAIR